MPEITIYIKPGCPYCARAMALLDAKGAQYVTIIASSDPDLRAAMVARAHGRNTFPQIFIGDTHVGGCDDLLALEAKDQLDPLLRA